MTTRFSIIAAVAATLGVAAAAGAQQPKPRYPLPPVELPEAEEVALALSAAPAEISRAADVYVLRGTAYLKVRSGTNGCACLVGRDLHEGSRYPICFDQESTKTTLHREIMEGSLRARGKSEEEVKSAVEAAYMSGELRMPSKTAMAYMMSPSQVLFSSPLAEGVRVGAWSPHVMLMMHDVTAAQLGLLEQSTVDVVSLNRERKDHAELVVKVPTWSDGTPVKR